MAPEQTKAIQESFATVAPISEHAAALFYGRLSEIAPAVTYSRISWSAKPTATVSRRNNGWNG
jgi:hypothetical protein